MKNPVKWLISYFREAKEELQKVSWPSRMSTVRYSLLVIGVSIAMAGFFAGLDWALNLGLEKLIEISA